MSGDADDEFDEAQLEPQSTLVPVDVLRASPSFKDGITAQAEVAYRMFGCELIQQMGILLNMPQVCMVMGQVLFHRFYYRRSFAQFDAHVTAMASLFLAGKVEECTRRMRDIINVAYHLKLRKQGKRPKVILLGGDLYITWKAKLIRYERMLLKELGFNVFAVTDIPHKYILYYVKALGDDAALAQESWNFLNDCMRLDLCVRYRSEAIACAAIALAASRVGFPLPSSVPWHDVFSTSAEEIAEIGRAILGMYSYPVVGWLPSLRKDANHAEDVDVGEEPPSAAAVAHAVATAAAAFQPASALSEPSSTTAATTAAATELPMSSSVGSRGSTGGAGGSTAQQAVSTRTAGGAGGPSAGANAGISHPPHLTGLSRGRNSSPPPAQAGATAGTDADVSTGQPPAKRSRWD